MLEIQTFLSLSDPYLSLGKKKKKRYHWHLCLGNLSCPLALVEENWLFSGSITLDRT